MTTEQDQLVDREEILRLHGGPWKRSGEWLMAFCPVPRHGDGQKHSGRSGESLGLSDSGVLKCMAGCEFKEIMEALRGGRPVSLAASRNQRDGPEKQVALYQYKDEAGTVIAEKARFETPSGRKSFRWRMPGAETWSGLEGIDMRDVPLYGAQLLQTRPDDDVYFVEGEKACEACWNAGLLAVTHGGGAGTRDFGRSLDVLKGRSVRLWPDNDAPGRSFMILLQAHLEPLASRLRLVNVDLPEKGDAYDYFARGGKAEDIESWAPNEPVVQVLAEDALRITIPTVGGPVVLTFEEMEKTAHSLETELSIACFQFPAERPYSERINLLSNSARTELRRDLDSVCGKEYGWTQVLNTAWGLARETFMRQDRGIEIYDIPDAVGDVLLLPPLLVADGPTIFFGDGSSLKSYFVFVMMLCISLGIRFCNFPTPYLRILLVDYEDSATNVRRRFKRVARGLDSALDDLPPTSIYYWDARGIPLKDQVEAIQRKCAKDGIGLIVIDSAGPACGGPPEDSVSALSFFRALKKLGLPAIVIAHITKGSGLGDNTQKPFGSVYWHNEARRTWYVKRVQEEDSDELDIGLFCRKVNDGRLPAPLVFHATFDGSAGPVQITMGSFEKVPELLDETNDKNRVYVALGQGSSRTIAEISQESGLTAKAVETVLRRGPFVQTGESRATGRGRPAALWARRSERDDEPLGQPLYFE